MMNTITDNLKRQWRAVVEITAAPFRLPNVDAALFCAEPCCVDNDALAEVELQAIWWRSVAGGLAVFLAIAVGLLFWLSQVVYPGDLAYLQERNATLHQQVLDLQDRNAALKAQTGELRGELDASTRRLEKRVAMLERTRATLLDLADRLRAERDQVRRSSLVSHIRSVNPEADAEALAERYLEAQATHGVPAGILARIGEIESHYRANAVSATGARGVMQVSPFWRGKCWRPFGEGNIDCAARILRYECRGAGTLNECLARYNNADSAGSVQRYVSKFWNAW